MAGVVLTALGLKKVLEYVGDAEHHTLSDPLKGVALVALLGGAILYLLAHVLFRWLTVHTWSLVRLIAAAGLVIVLPLMRSIPALGQLAILTAVVAGALIVEARIYAESRQRIRAELSHR